MKKYTFLIWFSLCSLIAEAHQADISSTMLVEQDNGDWILQIRSALTAFEYEIHAQYGETSYSTPEEFKTLVIQHNLENIEINFDKNDTVELRNGKVKLGHETIVIFEVLGLPNSFKELQVKNSSFKNIHRNQSALVVLKHGVIKEQYTLNNDNNHAVTLLQNGSQFVLQKTNSNVSIWQCLPYLIAVIICVTVFLNFMNKNTRTLVYDKLKG